MDRAPRPTTRMASSRWRRRARPPRSSRCASSATTPGRRRPASPSWRSSRERRRASTLAVGDVITAVGSTRAVALGPLVAAVGAVSPGRSIVLTFHGFGSRRPQRRSVVVDELRSSGSASAAAVSCVPAGSAHGGRVVRRAGRAASCLPLYPEQLYDDENEPFRDLDQRRRHRRFVGGALVHARADRQARPR